MLNSLLKKISPQLLLSIQDHEFYIQSFDHSISEIKQFLENFEIIEEKKTIILTNIIFKTPQMHYMEYIGKDTSYAGQFYATIEGEKKETYLFDFPIPIGSKYEYKGEYNGDIISIPDGYFLVKGHFYVCCNWELLVKNKIMAINEEVSLTSQNQNMVTDKVELKIFNTKKTKSEEISRKIIKISIGRKSDKSNNTDYYDNFIRFLTFFIIIKGISICWEILNKKIKIEKENRNPEEYLRYLISNVFEKQENIDIKSKYSYFINFLLRMNTKEKDIYKYKLEEWAIILLEEQINKIEMSQEIRNNLLEYIYNTYLTYKKEKNSFNINTIIENSKNYFDLNEIKTENSLDIKNINYLNDFLDTLFINYLGNNIDQKIEIMIEMLYKLVGINSNKKELFMDIRDDLQNKMIDTFANSFKNMIIKKITKPPKKKTGLSLKFKEILENLNKIINDSFTGNTFGMKSGKNISKARHGLSTLANIRDFKQRLILRKIKITTNKDGTVQITGRLVHESHAPSICSTDTSEGENCGHVKNFALHTMVSDNINPKDEKQFLKEESSENGYPVYINDIKMGYVENPKEFREKFIKKRRNRELHQYSSITFIYNIENPNKIWKIEIRTHEGRILVPFYIIGKDGIALAFEYVKNKLIKSIENDEKIFFSLTELIDKGYIEYIDQYERKMIGEYGTDPDMDYSNTNVTHSMISPGAYLSLTLEIFTIFQGYSKTERETYTANLIKASSSEYIPGNIYDYASDIGFQKRAHRRIIGSTLSSIRERTSYNVRILFAPFKSGYNIEDAIVMSERFIETWDISSIQFKNIIIQAGVSTQRLERDREENEEFLRKIGYPNGIINVGEYVKFGTILGITISSSGVITPQYSKIRGKNGIVESVKKLTTKAYFQEYEIKIKYNFKANIGDKYSCYSDDTEILTNKGWKLFKNLTMKDKIASMSQNGKFFTYENPLNLQNYDYDGKMYHIKSDNIDLLVTDNHRMYVKTENSQYKIIEAKNIYNKILYYKKNIDEGYKAINNNYINNNDLDLNSLNKLPEWCFNLDIKQSKKLIKYIFIGNKYETKLSQLADDLQILCLHAGYASNIIYNNNIYKINIINDIEPIVNKIKKQDEWINYKGKVYCCSVPNGIIYVRRNINESKKAIWCGNSIHGQKGVVSTIIPYEDLPFDEKGIRPDIIVNPHGQINRTTISQLMEAFISEAFIQGLDRKLYEIANLFNYETKEYDFYLPLIYLDPYYKYYRGINPKGLKFNINELTYKGLVRYIELTGNENIIREFYTEDINITNNFNKKRVTLDEISIQNRENLYDKFIIDKDILISNTPFTKWNELKKYKLKFKPMSKEADYIKWSELNDIYQRKLRTSPWKDLTIPDVFIIEFIKENEELRTIKVRGFEDVSYLIARARKRLKDAGMNEGLSKYYYKDHKTGEIKEMESLLFAGWIALDKLKQISENIIHSSMNIQIDPKTGKPPKGKNNNGGLRFGEMEVRAAFAHGLQNFLEEKRKCSGTNKDIAICSACHSIGWYSQNIFICGKCNKDKREGNIISLPNIMIQFDAVIAVMGLSMKFIPEEKEE